MSVRLQASSAPAAEIRAVLHGLGDDLAKWLHGQFLRHAGRNWWKHHVCTKVDERDQERIADGEWKELTDLDLAALLGLLQWNFKFLSSKRALPKDARDRIRAMKKVRNRWAHWPLKGIPVDEVELHLATMRDFSKLLGGGKARSEEIDRTEDSLRAFLAGGVASPAEVEPELPMIPDTTKHLVDFFGDDDLTPSQQRAVKELEEFLKDPDAKCFILRGYAGTGKTFLIGGLVRYLEHVHRKPEMMAPTGRAAHVLRGRHQVDASTVHRHIYSLSELKEYRELDESGDVTYKFYFDLKNNDIEHDTVFVVDEASMLSDVYSESEFMHFGSGRLLSDLLRYINFDANDYRKKLILVGDNAQLPPVGMNSSPALNAGYLAKSCLLPSRERELTDVVRQLDSSLILQNATKLRELLRSDRLTSFDFVSDGEAVRELKPAEFVSEYVAEREAGEANNPVIVTYTNASARTYNEAVRQRLFPDKTSPAVGDQIIIVRNNYNHERALLNGQMGQVVATSDQTAVHTVPLNVGLDDAGKRKIESIRLEFRNATLRFDDEQDGAFEITCMVFEECLHNQEAGVPSVISKALYVDFRNRHPNLKPGQPEFKEALKADPYFNAVMLKFGYAITCHKAQGGEWHTVFVDFAGKNKLETESLRWSYTALTRAEAAVVATNALHHHVLKPKKPTGTPTREVRPGTALEEPAKASHNNEPSSPTATPSEAVRRLVEGALPSGWQLATARALPYQERFTLSANGTTVTLSVYYNSKDRISKVQITPVPEKPDLDETARLAFRKLKGCTLLLEAENEQRAGEGFREFAETLRSELEAVNGKVVMLEPKSEYHLQARLRVAGEEGAVNYYFDKNGSFTRFLPQPGCPQRIINQLEEIHV
jgi:hypothetical protein